MPAYLAARRRGCRSSCTSRTRCPAWPTGSAPGIAQRVAVSFPDTAAAARPSTSGCRSADDLRRSTGTRCAPRRGRSSASTPTGRPWSSPAARRAPGSSTTRSRPPPRRSRPAGVQVLHVVGPKAPPRRRPTACRYVVEPFVDRMDYALAAADLMVCRAGATSVTEAAAVGVPAIFVPLPIGNGEQELNARPVVDAGGALLVADADFTPDWVAANVPGAGHRPRAARRDGRGRVGPDPARRRREAGADRPRGGPVKVRSPRLSRGPLGRVHLVGIGGAGLSGIARLLLARGIEVSGSDGVASPTLDALRELGATVHVGHDPRHLDHLGDGDTVVVSTAVRADNPEYVEATGAASPVLLAVRRAGRADGRPPRGRRRRHARQDHDHVAAHRRAPGRGRRPDVRDRRRPRRHRRQRRRGHRATCSWPRPTRATAPSSSTGRTPRSSPTSRPTTSTTGGPRRPTPRRSRSSPTPSTPTASWSAASTTPAPPRWPSGSAPPGAGWSRSRRGRASPTSDPRRSTE